MKKSNKKVIGAVLIGICILAVAMYVLISVKKSDKQIGLDAETRRAMTYVELTEEDSKIENCDFVKFGAFFLRDIDQDGNANPLNGTCKNVSETDTLYMEINVLSKGYLKEGATITINGDNFRYKTAIVKDSVIAENYISDNTKSIKLKQVKNGTQKLIYGEIVSNLNSDISKYSSDANSVTLKGIYVDDEGNETEISKTVNLTVDWYGEVQAEIPYSYAGGKMNSTQKNAFEDIVTTEEDAILTFTIAAQEKKAETLLSENYLEGKVPELNGYKAKNVTVEGTNIEYTWNENEQKFTTNRKAVLNENKITTNANSGKYYENRYNEYKITITYPIEAYNQIQGDTVNLIIPVSTYYVGYTNDNEEFNEEGLEKGLTKSNIASGTITLNYSVVTGDIYNFYIDVGKYVMNPTSRYVVSKEKAIYIYNNLEEKEEKDYYTVRWIAVRGIGDVDKIVMKEDYNNYTDKFLNTSGELTSMIEKANINNVGIYFANADSMLKEDGYINVYDDETNELIHTFTKEDWNLYTQDNPYYYELPVRHVRIETSITNQNTSLSVYNVKEIDDEKLVENVSREDFNRLTNIYSYLTGTVYNNGEEIGSLNRNDFAKYEDKFSYFKVTTNADVLSTQETIKNQKIYIRTIGNEYNESQWKNAIFLVKLPEDIISLDLNSVESNDSSVQIPGYDVYEENGNYYIKILTENEEETKYTITIDCDMTVNQAVVTKEDNITVYGYNESYENYYENESDIYDINSNQNEEEYIGIANTKLQLVSPSSLITSETITEYNDDIEGELTIAPNIADVTKNQRKATINVKISNNYTNTISGTKIIGKIPFQGNTYVTNSEDLSSRFTTSMTNEGIIVPEEIKDIVKVYYSTNGKPSQDIDNENNNWKLKEDIEDFSQIKTYLIDFENYKIPEKVSYNFSYEVSIPEGIEYSKVAYSVHAVYFGLDTEEGTYQSKTESNKVGLRIARKYKMQLTKYRKFSQEIKIPGAFYTITGQDEEGNIVLTRTIATDATGNINIENLYVGLNYVVQEIKSPINYELNDEDFGFKVIENEEGNLVLETNSDKITLDEQKEEVNITAEDEVKYNLELTKQDEQGNMLKGIKYQLTGDGLDTTRSTTSEGKLTIRRLQIGTIYTLSEIQAEGYYLNEAITFSVTRNEEGKLETNLPGAKIEEVGDNIVVKTTQVDEKIPTYNLEILKVSNIDKDNNGLKGARYKITNKDNGKIWTEETNEEGKIIFENLYQYVDGKDITGKYEIQETKAPDGYTSNTESIVFYTKSVDGQLEIYIENEESLSSIKEKIIDGNNIRIILQDNPLFTLNKIDEDTKNPIEGAKFIIYKSTLGDTTKEFAKDINGNYVGELDENGNYVVTTDKEGKVTLALPGGFYKAVEIEAPGKYVLPENEKDRARTFIVNGYTEKPCINYIEDLVDLSNDVNLGQAYEGVKIELARTLDFNSNSSYRNYNDTSYGDYNGDGIVEGIKQELTNTSGTGFKPIGNSDTRYFCGTFDGKGNEINNIYINSLDETAGLFGYIKNSKILNLTISGQIKGENTRFLGGFIGRGEKSVIQGCNNKANIKMKTECDSSNNRPYSTCIGGIVGIGYGLQINNCKNYVNIENTSNKTDYDYMHISSSTGGIAGTLNDNDELRNCINYGAIISSSETVETDKISYYGGYMGGITGFGGNIDNCINYSIIKNSIMNFPECYIAIGGISGICDNISNSYNIGNINSNAHIIKINTNIGGVVGNISEKLMNCYNTGDVIAEYTKKDGNVYGATASANKKRIISNCYNTGRVSIKNDTDGKAYADGIFANEYSSYELQHELINIENCYYLTGTLTKQGNGTEKEESFMKSQDFVELLNSNKDLLLEEDNSINLSDWIQVSDSYPMLDLQSDNESIVDDEMTEVLQNTDITIENVLETFSITTEIKENSEGQRIGGTITGDEDKNQNNIKHVEDVRIYQNSKKTIEIKPNGDYFIDAIWVNNEKIEFTPDENRNVILPAGYFENVTENKHIIVRFEKIRNFIISENTNFIINKKDKETNKTIPQTKFVIYKTTPTYEIVDFAKYKNGEYIGERISDGRYIVKTDENGQIKLELPVGYYKAVEVEAAEDYKLKVDENNFKIANSKSDFEINYIEDLVDLSNEVNDGDNFEGKTVDLLVSIDFNDDKSYKNPEDTTYGDYNGDGKVEGIKQELTNTSGTGFKPIGSGSTPFKGIFNGNSYEIKNIYQNLNNNFGGLFASISSAKILNLGIVGGSISSSYPSGGLVGYVATDSTISNCYNAVNITTTRAPAGGIIGFKMENSTMNSCYNTGTISATNSSAGGIIGESARYSTISNCYNEGNILSAQGAGITFDLLSSNISNCYNAGSISTLAPGAGIIYSASSSKISNCYNIGEIESGISIICGIGYSVSNTTMRNLYYLNTIAENGINIQNDAEGVVESKTQEEMQSEEFVNQLNENVEVIQSDIKLQQWNYNNGAYPTLSINQDILEDVEQDIELKEFTITNEKLKDTIITKIDKETNEPIPNTKFAIYSITDYYDVIDFAKTRNGDYVGEKNENGIYVITTDENGQIKLKLPSGYYKAVEVEAAEGYVFEKDEALRTTYFKNGEEVVDTTDTITADRTINYIEDLVDLSNEVNAGQTFEGITIELARSLDFNDDSSYKNSEDSTTYGDYNGDGEVEGIKQELTNITGSGFRPIGIGSNYAFKGTFEGNSNEIKNIYINRTGEGIGLFGYVANGKVSNLGLTGNGSINCSGSNGTGGIAGYINNATIENCYNSIQINGYGYAGGIVGNSTGDKNEIINCYNSGEITMSLGGGTGGIIGYLCNGTVISCYNTAKINGFGCAGGIIGGSTGSKNEIINCYNSGEITISNGGGFAGIIGQLSNGTVINCYNTATISASSIATGGIAYNVSNSQIINCYNTGDISSSAPAGGIVATSVSNSTIENCYNIGKITSTNSYIGGIIGYSVSNSTITSCYYLNTTAERGIYNRDNAEGIVESKTVEEMKSEEFVNMLNKNTEGMPTELITCTWKYNQGAYPTLEKVDWEEKTEITIENIKEQDNIVINKIDKDTKQKLAGANFKLENLSNYNELIGNMMSSSRYSFTKSGTQYYSNNRYVNNSVANAYFPIDLRDYTGTFKLSVNYSISSQANYDIGYATITTTTSVPAYNQNSYNINTNYRFIYTSGSYSNQTASINLTGGKKYYLHIGYRKNESFYSYDDRFYINSMNLTYNPITVQTNEEGIASAKVPIGTYKITETQAPFGYSLNSESQTIDIANLSQISKFTFENEKEEIVSIANKNFILTKKDKETNEVLEGVKFMVLDEQGNYAKDYTGTIVGEKEEIDGQEKYVVTTDENGQIKLRLDIGKYKLVEVKTLEGYALEEKEQEFEITNENLNYEVSWEGNVVTSHYPSKDYIRATSDGGMIETSYGINKTIPAEDTVNNEAIQVTSDKGIILKYNNQGKVEKLVQIAGFTGGTAVYEDSEGNYIVVGEGKQIEIPAENTTSGEAITLEYTGTSSRTITLKLNGDLKVIWASKIDSFYPSSTCNTYIGENKSGDYLIGIYPNNLSSNAAIPAEDTVNKEEIDLSYSVTGPTSIILKLTKDGKIRIANKIVSVPIESLVEKENGGYVINDSGYRGVFELDSDMNLVRQFTGISGISINSSRNRYVTKDEGFIVVGTLNSNTTILGENTESGEAIQINAEVLPSMVLIKYNKDFKIEWVKVHSNASVQQIKQDTEGNYIALIQENNDVKVVQYDGQGNIINMIKRYKTNSYMYTNNDNTQFILHEYSKNKFIKYNFKEASIPLDLTVTNQKAAQVTVHHYLEGTGEEYGTEAVMLAENEVLEGKEGDEYTTSPNMMIKGYVLIQDEQGEYIIPENASGIYDEEEQNVYYYYNEKPLELVVHHYLEGTEDKLAEDEHYYYEEGNHYKTNASEEVLKSYEFVEVVGDEEKDITQNEEVTYYYRIKKYEITTKVEVPKGREAKGGTISGEGLAPYETVDYGKTSIKDIVIKADTDYRIKQIRLVSTDEEGNKIESIIYGENKIEDGEITYKTNTDGSLILTKFENMTEDKEVIVVFEPDEGRLIVHHYIENSTEKIYDDQVIVDLIGTEVETMPVKVENYVVVKEPADRNATITKQTQEKVYYYQRQYKITTDVIEHNENYKDGGVKEHIKGGTITDEDKDSHEYVLKNRNSQEIIEITPDEGYEIVKVTINGKEFDYKSMLDENEKLTIPEGFFQNMQEDKHIEVEFRKKTVVYVKYLELGTEKVLYRTEDGKDYEEILGYEGKEFETYRKSIPNYKTSDLGITDENKVAIEPNGTMFADEITIIYWYEKVPSGILVKHVEKITTKTINEETGEEEIKVTGVILDEEVIPGYAGDTEETTRKEFENYIPAENLDATEGINVGKDENSKIVTLKQDEVAEVVYWYEKEFNITTDVIEHEEQDSEGNIISIKGGTISGEDEEPYEKVVRANNSTKEIKIVPDDGYRIKRIIINDEEIYVEDKIAEDRSLTLTSADGYFKNMQEDKHVVVEFEKIPAKVIVQYKDVYTKESILEDKVVEGYVNDEYNEQRAEVESYIPADPDPENSQGTMTEDPITVTYWYTKQFYIRTRVRRREEEEGSGEEGTSIKGGTISGEEQHPYEIVTRGETSTCEILMVPDSGFRIKSLTINDIEVEIKDLLKEDGSINLPFFENMQENKDIVVEFEKMPTTVRTQYLEDGTENPISEEEIKPGYVNDEYKTEPKQIKYYDLVEEKYPENSEGTMTEDEILVKYYYKKIPFNMKIEKELGKVQVNGSEESVDLINNKLAKLEINYKDINSTNIEITYNIKVTNAERIEGTALIEELLPEGFEFIIESSSEGWILKDGRYILQTQTIQPGETKEYKVTLRWKPEEENKGQKQNTAKITQTTNEPNYEETTLEDNKDDAIIEIKLNKTIQDIINNAADDIKNGNIDDAVTGVVRDVKDIVTNVKTGDTITISVVTLIVAGVVVVVVIKKRKKSEDKSNLKEKHRK